MYWVCVVFLVGCVRSASNPCGDAVCAENRTCVAALDARGGEVQLCALPEQLEACVGHGERERCMLGTTLGTCHGGACTEDACGNGLLDQPEGCDDRNNTSGDGCASDCLSTETCGNGFVDPIRIVGETSMLAETCDDGGWLQFDGCSPACKLEAPRWRQWISSGLTARSMSSATYDARRRRLFVFSGKVGSGLDDISWEWNGTIWARVPTVVTPPPRVQSGLAYDHARGRSVLFGGLDDSAPQEPLADTWEWDGEGWNAVVPSGLSPQPRYGHALVYDPKRRVVVMFGGFDGTTTFDDTWEWDGAAWTKRNFMNHPSARRAHVMAYDPRAGKVILFGGAGGSGETWSYDGMWTKLTPATSPSSRSGPVMAWDPRSERIMLFGGAGVLKMSDTWAWNGTTWTQLAVSGPGARDFALFALDGTGELVLQGGANGVGTSTADLWHWTGIAWTQLTVTAPPVAADVTATLDVDRGRVVFFGGHSAFTGYYDTTTELIGDAFAVVTPSPPPALRPAARARAAMAYHVGIRRSVMFGGESADTIDDGTWGWDGSVWTQLLPPADSPPQRAGAAMAYDATAGEIVMFGGDDFGETWTFDGAAWTKRSSSNSPPVRANAHLAYDPIRKVVVLFGGLGATVVLHDQWEWHAGQWKELTGLTSPPARHGAGFAWNAHRQRLTLGGGFDSAGNILEDIWEWDGSTWQLVDVDTVVRGFAPLVTSRGGVVRITGADPTQVPRRDVWRLQYQSTLPTERCDGRFDLDLDGKIGCDDPDCWWRCTPRCMPGTSCDPSAPRCGDGTCNAAIEDCAICPADCGACVASCGDFICDPPETAASCPGDC